MRLLFSHCFQSDKVSMDSFIEGVYSFVRLSLAEQYITLGEKQFQMEKNQEMSFHEQLKLVFGTGPKLKPTYPTPNPLS